MPLFKIDHAGIARSLSQIAEQRHDVADVFLEQCEEIELPPEDQAPGLRTRCESGLAVRLRRGRHVWLAAEDEISAASFAAVMRRVARAMPRTAHSEPRFPSGRTNELPEAPELLEFPSTLSRALRRHGEVPVRLTAKRYRRRVRVVGTQVSSGVESELFYSLEMSGPWGRLGRLSTTLDDALVEELAERLAAFANGAAAPPPEASSGQVVLGPAAAAVLLHEAVAHALETDTLALGGRPEAAIGVELGPESLTVFDDPATAPEGVRRRADDEGHLTIRRCLLRRGVVEHPLADAFWAAQSEALRPGAGRRSHRHLPPAPRSTHLELVPGEATLEELFEAAPGGLYLPEAERGRLDPLSGDFSLVFPFGRRIEKGEAAAAVGRVQIRAHVSDILGALRAVGAEAKAAGAGWCAKGGMKLPVWATCPALLLEGLEVGP